MISDALQKHEPCPACGGAGGGPFGRAGSAWDDEAFTCSRCEGLGYVNEAPLARDGGAPLARPGVVKTAPAGRLGLEKKRRTQAG